MGALGPCAIGKKLHGPRRLAERNAKRVLDAVCVQPEQFAGSSSGGEHTAGGGGMKAPVVMSGWIERQRQPDLDFVPGDNSGYQFLARRIAHLRGGERSGNNGR